MTINAWDWDRNWKCVQVFEGRTHVIMNLSFHPKHTNTFASACLGRTVKIWNLTSGTATLSLEAHEKGGVNSVHFYPGPDKPYLLTAGDDRTFCVWDYLSKSCVATMEGQTALVSFAAFHHALSIIVSGSENGTFKIWNSGSYRPENTLSYALERAWCVAGANDVAVGFDEGLVVIKMGRDEPTFSMDTTGTLIYSRNTSVLISNLDIGKDDDAPDGARVNLVAIVSDDGTYVLKFDRALYDQHVENVVV
ncbi:WD40 repeat-like protein [Exidia glandulosa HHB12029]|uniref:WD40 repeat-like protein n=1 Tax=Exidia glandulosa HHB12029 TaxID=1314781 RepID=A0A165FV07_EXIGL|nr:WD40 repeat-like protein [Exidia glandulosa HHB12029]